MRFTLWDVETGALLKTLKGHTHRGTLRSLLAGREDDCQRRMGTGRFVFGTPARLGRRSKRLRGIEAAFIRSTIRRTARRSSAAAPTERRFFGDIAEIDSR